jgi:hypothetical protein
MTKAKKKNNTKSSKKNKKIALSKKKNVTKKPALKKKNPAKKSLIKKDNSLNELFKTWFSGTLYSDDLSFEEVLKRLSSLIRLTFDEFSISSDDADSILYSFFEEYLEMIGEEPYVCEDCKAENELDDKSEMKKEDIKLLN